MKAKEMSELILSSLAPKIEAEGYQHYKPKQFIKVINDVVMYIFISTVKSDVYIWHSVYPLCVSDLWLGRGTVGGRYPVEENELQVTTKEDVDLAIRQLISELGPILEFQKNRSTLKLLEESISDNEELMYSFLLKSFCLAEQKYLVKSAQYLEVFLYFCYNEGLKHGLTSPINFGKGRVGAENLKSSFLDGSTKEFLEETKKQNIKKLKLQKFISTNQ